jgi:hypothetical protein
MQSINQRPSANGGSHRGKRSGVLLRNVVMFLAITAALAVPAIAVAHSPKTKVHQCGNVHHNLAVMTKGKVSCKTAKNVARAWIKGKHRSRGFRCVKLTVPVGAGYQVACKNGSKKILIIPE